MISRKLINSLVVIVVGLWMFQALSTGAIAQVHGSHEAADRPDTAIAPSRYPSDYHSPGRPPASGDEIRKYAVDDTGPGATNFGVAPVHDNTSFATVRADRLEGRRSGETDNDVLLWDVSATLGNEVEFLTVESEGEWAENHSEPEAATLEFLYGQPLSAFWDWRVGIRQDVNPEPDRTFAVVGLTGLAPQWFETDANLNIGEGDDVRVDLEAQYNLLLSQRWVFQPRLETEYAFEDQPELNLGHGLTGVELGGRLRYELRRKFAPYVGISWESSLGETRDIVRSNGEDPDHAFAVIGLKFWY